MSRLLNTLVFLFVCSISFAQTSQVDDLIYSLDAKPPVSKVLSMYKIGESYVVSEPKVALEWYERGIDLAWGVDADLLAIQGLVKKSRIELDQKEFVQALNSSLNVLRYDIRLSDSLKSVLYTNLADALASLNAFELALEYRNKLMVLDFANMSLFDRYYLTENIGYYHSRLGNIDSANYYYHLSMNLAESTLDTNLMLHCCNNLGYHFFQNNLIDKSAFYFKRGMEVFHGYSKKEKRDSVIYAMMLVNRSDYFRSNNQLKTAKENIYKSNGFLNGSDSSYYIGNVIRLFSIYLIEKELDSCRKYMNLSMNLNEGFEFKETYLKNSIDYYRLTSEVENERIAISSLIGLLDDKKNSSANQMFIELIETQDAQIRKNLIKETQLAREEGELARSRMMWIILLLFTTLIIALMIFLIWRKKKREVNQEKLLLKEREIVIGKKETQKLSEALAFKNHDLTEFGIELSRKNELLKEVIVKLKMSKEKDDVLIDVMKLLERHVQVDDSLSLFHDNVEKVNHQFMNKLIKNYPNLTINDRQICAMLKLQLSSKEIATLKNISSDSVKKVRYRLRKKMELPNGVDLSEFFRDY